ncbi:unnamed protein product [Blepharisma stoltei]|uniref:Uncharacterized protein n=1 Tax=Blepharisma stoltei TaxID=1481888 RepID=A0AAU9K1R4_9CILI|nr:unnamed protein product [Blepharisma stoltei]
MAINKNNDKLLLIEPCFKLNSQSRERTILSQVSSTPSLGLQINSSLSSLHQKPQKLKPKKYKENQVNVVLPEIHCYETFIPQQDIQTTRDSINYSKNSENSKEFDVIKTDRSKQQSLLSGFEYPIYLYNDAYQPTPRSRSKNWHPLQSQLESHRKKFRLRKLTSDKNIHKKHPNEDRSFSPFNFNDLQPKHSNSFLSVSKSQAIQTIINKKKLIKHAHPDILTSRRKASASPFIIRSATKS